MYIPAREPLQNKTALDIESYYRDKQSPQDVADAFAVVSNQFWWVEDNEYDYEEGTAEHKKACSITDEWRNLMKKYEQKIFDLLQSEGIQIPATGRISVLAPFMQKYGYSDKGGWWIKE